MSSEWDPATERLVLTKGRLEKNMFESIFEWKGSSMFYDI